MIHVTVTPFEIDYVHACGGESASSVPHSRDADYLSFHFEGPCTFIHWATQRPYGVAYVPLSCESVRLDLALEPRIMRAMREHAKAHAPHDPGPVHLRPEVMADAAERWECFDCDWQGTRPKWRADHSSDCMECPNCGGDLVTPCLDDLAGETIDAV